MTMSDEAMRTYLLQFYDRGGYRIIRQVAKRQIELDRDELEALPAECLREVKLVRRR